MTEASKKTARGPSFAAVLILFATAAVWTETCLIGVNSLYQSDRWIVEKRMMIGGVGEPTSFSLTETPSRGASCTSGTGKGSIKSTREKLELRRLRAEVRIGSESHLYIFYNRGARGSSGIRLSGKSAGPAFSFLVNHDGEFLSKEPIATPELDDRWHSIELSGSGQEASLRIDGGFPAQDSSGFSVGSIGFGGDLGQIEVREISADSSQGPWREDFANRKNRVGGIAFSLLFLVLLSYLVSALSARSLLPSLKSATLATTSLGLSLLALCAIWLAFDTQFLARRPFSGITHAVFPGSPPSLPLLDRLDALRFRYFDTWFRFSEERAPR